MKSPTEGGGEADELPPLVEHTPLTDTHLVELPSVAGASLDASIGRANQRRLDDATKRLQRAFPGLVAELLRPRPTTTQPHTMPAQPPVSADDLWHTVDSILRHDDARAGRLTLALASAAPGIHDTLAFDTNYEIHRPHLGPLVHTLSSGAAMVIRAVSPALTALQQIAGDLTTTAGTNVEIDAVVFGPGATLVDDADRGGAVILVPLDGPLQASAVAAPRSAPGGPAAHRTPPAETSRQPPHLSDPPAATVAPGEAVLVAAGEELRAVASSRPNVALRMRVPLIDGRLLRALSAVAARYHPLLRADLPADLDAPIESYAGSLYDRPGAYQIEADQALGPKPQAHAIARLRATTVAVARNGLPEALRAQERPMPRLSCPLAGGVMVTRVGDDTCLAAGGLVVTLHPHLAERLAPHLDGRPFDPIPIIDELTELIDAGRPAGDTADEGDDTPSGQARAIAAFRQLLALEILEVAR